MSSHPSQRPPPQPHARIRPQHKHKARGLLAIGIFSRKLTTPLDKKFHALLATLRSQWPNIVGHTIAKHTMPYRLYVQRHRKKTILNILVTSMMATQYHYERQHILNWVNAYGGHNGIDDIHLTPTRTQQFTWKEKDTQHQETPTPHHVSPTAKTMTETTPQKTLGPPPPPPTIEHIGDDALRDALCALYQWSHTSSSS